MWERWKYEAVLVGTVAVWGFNFPVIKAALAVMHPHVVNAFRFTVSICVLAAVYVVRERKMGRRIFEPYRKHAKQIMALGLFGFIVYQLCFIIGIDNTTAGNAALIMASSPIWTAVTGRLFRLERLTSGSWAGLGITLTGTVVIVLTGTNEVTLGSSALFGNVVILAASICWGAYTALSKPVLSYVTPSGLAFLGLIPALPILYGISIPYFADVWWAGVSFWIWIAIVFSGALSTGIAIITWSMCVQHLGSSHTAAFGNMVPVVALVAGYFLLGEAITRGQIVGGAVVLIGLYAMRKARSRELKGVPPVVPGV